MNALLSVLQLIALCVSIEAYCAASGSNFVYTPSWSEEVSAYDTSPKPDCHVPGDGIGASLWYDNSKWNGQAEVTFGAPGGLFSVAWSNGVSRGGAGTHGEFDFAVGRTFYSSDEFGYGMTSISDLPSPFWATSIARWSEAPVGKLHTNLVIWIYENTHASNANSEGNRIDITISDYHHSPAGKNGWQVVGNDVSHAGSLYKGYSRGGNLGEERSYNFYRTDVRPGRDGESSNIAVDAKVFLEHILLHETYFDGNWVLGKLNWEVTGQHADSSNAPGLDLGDSSGMYEISCYSIPPANSTTCSEGGCAYCFEPQENVPPTVATPVVIPPASSENLFNSPSFETNSLESWESYGNTEATIEWQGVSGERSGRSAYRALSTDGLSQSLAGSVSQGATLRLSGFIKIHTSSGLQHPTQIQILRRDSAGETVSTVGSGTANSWSWTEVTGEWVVEWSGTLESLLVIFNGPPASEHFLLDDAEAVTV